MVRGGDIHSGLRTAEVGRASAAGVEFLLMQLQDGRDLFRYSLHCRASTWTLSGLNTTDTLGRLGFRQYRCPFMTDNCMAIEVGTDFNVDEFANAFGLYHSKVVAAEKHLEHCGYFLHHELYGDKARGDGHTSAIAEHKEAVEDDSFRYEFTWIEGGRDKGWVTHYGARERPVSPEMIVVMEMLGIRQFSDCPEFDFDSCFWRFTEFKNDGRSIFDSNAEPAYRWFRQHAEHFSPGIENLLEAHALVEPFGFRLLPTMPTVAQRITAEVQNRTQPPTVATGGAQPPRSVGQVAFFDVAISFAGTERPHAEKLATILQAAGFSVFYDNFYKAQLWGKDLPVFFDAIYRRHSRFCAMFVSKDYVERIWTNLERQSAQARAIQEKGDEYILPIRVDDSEVPGLLPTRGYVSINDGIDEIAALLIEKLQA